MWPVPENGWKITTEQYKSYEKKHVLKADDKFQAKRRESNKCFKTPILFSCSQMFEMALLSRAM